MEEKIVYAETFWKVFCTVSQAIAKETKDLVCLEESEDDHKIRVFLEGRWDAEWMSTDEIIEFAEGLKHAAEVAKNFPYNGYTMVSGAGEDPG